VEKDDWRKQEEKKKEHKEKRRFNTRRRRRKQTKGAEGKEVDKGRVQGEAEKGGEEAGQGRRAKDKGEEEDISRVNLVEKLSK
jgi:hypothetical protein